MLYKKIKLRIKSFQLLIIYLSSILFCNNIKSQTKADSLVSIVNTRSIADTLKIKLYGDIVWESMSSNIALSVEYANKALNLSKKLNRKADIAQAESDIGSVYNRQSIFDSALVHYKNALILRKELNQANKIAGIYANISTIYLRQSNFSEALELNFEALKLFEKINDEVNQASTLGNIGVIYEELEQLQLSEKFALKALTLSKKTKSSLLEGTILVLLGGLKYDQAVKYDSLIVHPLKLDTALLYLLEAEKIFEALNSEYKLSSVHNNIGRIFAIQKKYLNALTYYSKALKEREKVNDLLGVGLCYLNIGNILKNQNKLDQSINYFKKSITIFLELKSYINIKQVYANLAIIYKNKKDYTTAFEYIQLYSAYKDSIYSETNAKKIAEMQTLYETEKKENENRRLVQENKITKLEINNSKQKIEKRNQLIILLIISLLFVISIVLWQVNRVRLRKQQAEIETSKRIQLEKEKISRDLHDSVGGQLSFVLYSLEDDELAKNKGSLNNIANAVRNIISDLRQTIWAMSDDKLSLQSMSDKLKVYTRNLFSNKKVKIIFEEAIPEDHYQSSLIILNLFRACQEVINNAYKHSQCDQLTIRIKFISQIEIEIVDTGIGLNHTNTKTNGYGLDNIKYRINEINGKLSIKSEVGETCFKIII